MTLTRLPNFRSLREFQVRTRRLSRVLVLFASASLICSCTTVDYEKLEAGSFSGNLVVVWLGEGDDSSGDGRFLFVPDRNRPLTFRRPTGSERATLIRPEIMYTDGGSVPRFAQPFKGLSPWGYAPAYMIHDWLFAARHCLKDGSGDPVYGRLSDVTFEDSVKILGEAIKGLVDQKLVKRNDVAAETISFAVGSGIARNLWDKDGACEPVTPDDRRRANEIIAGSADPKNRAFRSGKSRGAVISTFSF